MCMEEKHVAVNLFHLVQMAVHFPQCPSCTADVNSSTPDVTGLDLASHSALNGKDNRNNRRNQKETQKQDEEKEGRKKSCRKRKRRRELGF